MTAPGSIELKSLTWFGRDCDIRTWLRRLLSPPSIEVVDLVWKGLRQFNIHHQCRLGGDLLKSLTWFGRDCDPLEAFGAAKPLLLIEVVDLVWKGLRHIHSRFWYRFPFPWIEVVDLVWKGLRHHRNHPQNDEGFRH